MCERCSANDRHASRARRRPSKEGDGMNGALNRKLLFVLGPAAGVAMFAAVVLIATFLTSREYKEPYRAPAATIETTPRVEGLAAERAAAESAARAKLYVEAEYRTFPVVGSR